jgi:hypothetical protein
MERLFAPALTAADLQALDPFAAAVLAALDDGSTARPVTLTTPQPPRPLGSSRAVRAASRRGYAKKRADIEAALRAQASDARPHPAPVGRKRRRPS